jgi:hypothetical protein
MRVTDRLGTAIALATARSAASVARPASAGSTTRTTSAPSYSPPTAVCDALGRTRISTRMLQCAVRASLTPAPGSPCVLDMRVIFQTTRCCAISSRIRRIAPECHYAWPVQTSGTDLGQGSRARQFDGPVSAPLESIGRSRWSARRHVSSRHLNRVSRGCTRPDSANATNRSTKTAARRSSPFVR